MSLCPDCIKGVRHGGTPEGEIEFIGGVRRYVSTPSGEYNKEKAVLFLPSIFGIDLINAQLLVDDFARNGFKTIAIDYLNGDPLPGDALTGGKYDIPAWFARHGNDQTRPNIDKVVAALREQGVKDFGSTGYCFGARYGFDIAFENISKVTVVSHPSLLKVPEDLEKYKKLSKAPLLINSCTFDTQFLKESQAEADMILGEGAQFTETYRREYFEGCAHGFAIRGDVSKPEVKAGKEGSFKAAVLFFKNHL
ncbi:dienelactone hydrolase [Pisolithus orientalis]|uniref:dienelactone hydrolase n=1 Tax=Pisolithus orientalis TaxID=936130 RepID=UPI0022256F7F|nr:dienelactone hydrolase [Pisolithus orientalis]KAI6012506.1 dienelactone hydrolase [Pisolithus orientalis]